jgi:hypothetical protein
MYHKNSNSRKKESETPKNKVKRWADKNSSKKCSARDFCAEKNFSKQFCDFLRFSFRLLRLRFLFILRILSRIQVFI